MRRKICLILIFILIFPSIFINVESKGNENNLENINQIQYEKGYRYNIQGFIYIHIEGEPYERGFQYGYLASAEIIDMICRWKEHGANFKILDKFPIKSPEKAWGLYKTRAVNKFLKQVPKEYKQEMQGITDGIKERGGLINKNEIEYEDIVTLQLLQDAQYSIKFFKKRFHPISGILSGLKDILSGGIRDYKSGHCSVFMATGDSTNNGGIVASHSTHFNALIAERCNIILDVKPSTGYRFVMATLPGSIWSQEDYYQNERGIILTETELPQGPWKMIGKPKGVRSRRAIQYSDSIDEVIKELKDGNNGLIPNEWLIGDTKTGEIASIELALYNTPIKRTFNGFYWSCNIPHNLKVIRELQDVPLIVLKILSKIDPKKLTNPLGEKFEEVKKEYYGKIDTEIAKKIMATTPICTRSTDCKITTSKLIENNGLIVLMGNPNGTQFNPTSKQKNKYTKITELPSSGWVEIYPSKSVPENLPIKNNDGISRSAKVLWKHENKYDYNENNFYNVISKNQIFTATKSGEIYSLVTNEKEDKINEKLVGKTDKKEIYKDFISTITKLELNLIEENIGEIRWKNTVGTIISKPVVTDDLVIVGCADGKIHAFDIKTGNKEWMRKFSDSVHLSNEKNDKIYVCSDMTCLALDTKNGNLLWKYKTEGPITSSPKIDKKSVYVGSWDGRLYAIDSETGKKKWTYQTGWGIDTTPEIKDGKVYFGSADNNFYALNAENGKLEWCYTCKGAIHSSAEVYGEYVYFGSDDGRLYALDKKTGNPEWAFSPGYTVEENDVNNYITTPITSDPVVKNGFVYIDVKGTSYVLDAQTNEDGKNIEKNPAKIDCNLSIIVIVLSIIILIVTLLIYFFKRQKIT